MFCEENASAQLNFEKSKTHFESLDDLPPFYEFVIDNLNNLGFLAVTYEKVIPRLGGRRSCVSFEIQILL